MRARYKKAPADQGKGLKSEGEQANGIDHDDSTPKVKQAIELAASELTMFPEKETCGRWRLQTTNPMVISIMKKRCRESHKWRQIGWAYGIGSPDIFLHEFDSMRNANRAFRAIMETLKNKAAKTANREKVGVDPKQKSKARVGSSKARKVVIIGAQNGNAIMKNEGAP
jgi:ribosomal silencing factor RsfS